MVTKERFGQGLTLLKRGVHRSIPVIAFFDDDIKELARFIEEHPI